MLPSFKSVICNRSCIKRLNKIITTICDTSARLTTAPPLWRLYLTRESNFRLFLFNQTTKITYTTDLQAVTLWMFSGEFQKRHGFDSGWTLRLPHRVSSAITDSILLRDALDDNTLSAHAFSTFCRKVVKKG